MLATAQNLAATPSVAAPAVHVDSLSKLYGSFAALRRVSCTFATGGLHVLLGENGAGKSTLLRIIGGLISPSAGSVTVLGTTPAQARRSMAYMSHAPMLYDELTAIENLQYYAALYNGPNHCGCNGSPEMALRAVGLDPHLTRPVSQLSQGMRQRASMARVLMADPQLLLLDEPFSNMDSDGVRQMIDLLLDFNTWPLRDTAARRTILLTTHQADLVTPVATSVLRLNGGMLQQPTTA